MTERMELDCVQEAQRNQTYVLEGLLACVSKATEGGKAKFRTSAGLFPVFTHASAGKNCRRAPSILLRSLLWRTDNGITLQRSRSLYPILL